MALFVTIVESGSLSAAGRALSMPKATVSRQLELLEKRLGAPLLRRSTRALSLTDLGRHYFERVRPIVHDAQAAQTEALAQHSTPSGLVRIAAPVAYGQFFVAPALHSFLMRYPAVRIDLRLSDERVRVVAEGFDVALRMGHIEDSELVGRSLPDIPELLVASRAYLDRQGIPHTVEELRKHQIVVTRTDLDHWNLDGQSVRVRWRMSTGSMLATRDAVLANLGIALVPLFLIAPDLATGQLVRVLPDCQTPLQRATILYSRTTTPSLVVKTLIDDLIQQLSGRDRELQKGHANPTRVGHKKR
jgi:DNA-binding transcriptional LysR family regulator